MKHKSKEELLSELSAAQKLVKVGGIYAHYKDRQKTYKVINVGFIESNDQLCVIYHAIYAPELIFVRPLKSWLEKPEWEGQEVPRFLCMQ